MRNLIVLITAATIICTNWASAAAKSGSAKPTDPQTGRWVVMETNKGIIKAALYEKDAPITTKNFIELVNRKFYDGLTFHRYEPGFVIQGGDPNGDGTGGSEKTIKLEVTPKLKFDSAGVMGMARTQDPNSATSQFFITLDAAPHLDMKYAVFGRVVQGLDVLKKLRKGDKMLKVRIANPPTPVKKPVKPAVKTAPKSTGSKSSSSSDGKCPRRFKCHISSGSASGT